MKQILMLLVLILVTACGNSPLVSPEDEISVTQISTPLNIISTTEVATLTPTTLTPTGTTTPIPTNTTAPTSTLNPKKVTETAVSHEIAKKQAWIEFGVTPPPTTFIKTISDVQLTFNEDTHEGMELKRLSNILAHPKGEKFPFELLGWATQNEIVVRPGMKDITTSGQLPTPTPGPETQWAIDLETGQVRHAPEWRSLSSWTEEQQQLATIVSPDIPQLKSLNNLPLPLKWYPSPDGQYIAASIFHQYVNLYKVADETPLAVLPPNNLVYDFRLFGGKVVWSADGSYLAYSAATTSPLAYEGNFNLHWGRPVYQVHITNAEGHQFTQFDLPWPSGAPEVLGWSSNTRFFVLSTQIGQQTPESLLVVRFDDLIWNQLAPRIEPGLIDDLFWSPSGDMIAYGDRKQGIIRLMKVAYP